MWPSAHFTEEYLFRETHRINKSIKEICHPASDRLQEDNSAHGSNKITSFIIIKRNNFQINILLLAGLLYFTPSC